MNLLEGSELAKIFFTELVSGVVGSRVWDTVVKCERRLCREKERDLRYEEEKGISGWPPATRINYDTVFRNAMKFTAINTIVTDFNIMEFERIRQKGSVKERARTSSVEMGQKVLKGLFNNFFWYIMKAFQIF